MKAKVKRAKPMQVPVNTSANPSYPPDKERNSIHYPTDHALDVAIDAFAQKLKDYSMTVDEHHLRIKQLIEAVGLLSEVNKTKIRKLKKKVIKKK